jgi:hypothetical protein
MQNLSSLPLVNAIRDLSNEQSRSNRESWKPVLERFEASLKEVSSQGDEKSYSRQQDRGQLLGTYSLLLMLRFSHLTTLPARDRISLLLDHDSPFLELGAFAGFGNKDSNACGNLITGIGSVS